MTTIEIRAYYLSTSGSMRLGCLTLILLAWILADILELQNLRSQRGKLGIRGWWPE